MYALKQAGKLAHNLLTKCLNPYGYFPCQFTSGLWRHKWRPTTFSLVVDDFGIKHIGIDHAKDLINTLQQWYKISIDWSCSLFCGMSIKWDYTSCTCNISMPGYIDKALAKYQQQNPTQPQHSQYKHIPTIFGVSTPPTPTDRSPPMSPTGIKSIQDIVSILLYYAQAVDPTLAAALSSIATCQAKGTQAVQQACNQLFDYIATHLHESHEFIAFNMILAVNTDA